MRTSPRTIAAIAAAALLALTGCTTGDTGGNATGADASSTASAGTITHALGTTVLPDDPQRVVALGWGSADAAIALGVVPVGMEAQSYGGDERGVLPWTDAALTEAGAETPAIITATAEAPAYEEIAALNPDLILAPYSGIDQAQYDLLAQIAPTVAYPDAPWTTPWRDVIELVGESLGRADEATALVASIDDHFAGIAAEHPEFAGLTVAMVWDYGGVFSVYKAADARVQFLEDLGFTIAPSVDALSNGDSTFFYTISYERTTELTSDVLVTFADTPDEYATFLAQPYAQAMPAVAAGAVAVVEGQANIASVSPPTALSYDWNLDAYVEQLAAAAAAAQA